MKKQILNTQLSDKKSNEWLKFGKKGKDAWNLVAKLRQKFAGYNAGQKDGKWMKNVDSRMENTGKRKENLGTP